MIYGYLERVNMGFFEGLFVTDVRYDKIKEQYTIVGMTGFRNALNRYGEKNLDNIFTSIGRTEIIFPAMFVYEVISMFKDTVKRPIYGVNIKALNKIIGILETRVEENREYDIDNKLDYDMIKEKMIHTPFEYQQALFDSYEKYKYRTGYRGLTIGAAPGLGKTNISLTFAEMLHSEKVLVICPLPTLEKVWLKSIAMPGKDNLYKDPSKNSTWSVKSPAVYNNEKFIIVHYEGLEQLYGILPKIAGPKLTIIVDESHNFADTKSKRTILLQDIIDRSFTKNLFLLSGTPIKSYSTEIINMAKFIDGKLKGDLYNRLYSVYSNPNKFFKSILPGRYNEMTYVIEKKETVLEPVIKTYIPITLKNSKDYTLPAIREQMREFINRRIGEIERAMPKTVETYELCLTIAAQNGFDKKSKYSIRQYRNLVATIQEAYKKKQLGFISNEMALANTIEREIKSYIPPELGKQWDEVKTIIKYPMLKVQGECLGKIVMGARIKCHVDIALNLDYEALLNSTIKDTIIFSNYINVCEAARSVLANLKYDMALVYGEYAKNLNKEVKRFIDNKNVNPLVTTYKSLSTGVPLTNANVIVALDLPFRMYIFEQAISRAWRVGQDSQVVVYIPSLDTGNVPNINQRNLDIISFFNSEVEALTGYKSSIDVKETDAINLESINQLINFDTILKDYDTEIYRHKVLNW